jgi:phage major head subunit gpT-like protein
MGIVNGETLFATQIGFSTTFKQAFDLAQTSLPLWANEAPSKGKSEQYKWPLAIPLMSEWVDEAQYEQAVAQGWQIDNKTFMAGVEIEREDIEDDNLAIWSGYVAQLGEEAKQHPYRLLVTLLEAGFATKCYDGQNFFSTTHKDKGSNVVWENLITDHFAQAGFEKAKLKLRRMKDTKGRPLNLTPSHLFVPPDLEAAALGVVAVDRLANGASNPNYKAVEVVVDPFLASAQKWYLADLTKRVKPFVYQLRRAAQFVAQDQPTDENAMARRTFRYQVNGRWNVGYGLPQFVVGSDGST